MLPGEPNNAAGPTLAAAAKKKRRKMRSTPSIILLLAVSLAGCAVAPELSMTAKKLDTGTEFEFSPRGVNGLLEFRVWRADTKELLWDVNLNYYRGARLRYGDVPQDFETFNGMRNSATQSFPDSGQKPRPLPADSRLFVSFDCQYDSHLTPSTQTFFFSVTTGAGASVSAVSPIEYLTPDDFPKQQ